MFWSWFTSKRFCDKLYEKLSIYTLHSYIQTPIKNITRNRMYENTVSKSIHQTVIHTKSAWNGTVNVNVSHTVLSNSEGSHSHVIRLRYKYVYLANTITQQHLSYLSKSYVCTEFISVWINKILHQTRLSQIKERQYYNKSIKAKTKIILICIWSSSEFNIPYTKPVNVTSLIYVTSLQFI
jgi:hypothetical protein